MRYNYICNSCTIGDKWLVFEVEHGMNEKPKISCPKCGGTETEICFLSSPTFYVKGNGWLDVKGRRRDMHLWKLQNDDPYASMREPGEKEELAASLRKGGKHNSKAKTFYVNQKSRKNAK